MTSTDTESGGARRQSGDEGKSRLKRLARVASVLYLAIFVIYPLSTMVRSMLVVPGDAAATARPTSWATFALRLPTAPLGRCQRRVRTVADG